MNFVGRIIPVFIGWLIWRKTGNIIFGALIAVLLESLLGPILQEIGLLFVKALKIDSVDEIPADAAGKGTRVLVGVKSSKPQDIDSMVADAEKELSKDAKFAGMIASVREAGLPEFRYKCEYKAKNNGEITKTFRELRKLPDVAALNTDDKHFFGYDEPNGDYFVAWLFSKEIAVPEVDSTQAADNAPAAGSVPVIEGVSEADSTPKTDGAAEDAAEIEVL